MVEFSERSVSVNGVEVTLLEAGPGPSTRSRASTFHGSTLDLLGELRLADALVACGRVAPKLQYRDRDEGIVAELDYAAIQPAGFGVISYDLIKLDDAYEKAWGEIVKELVAAKYPVSRVAFFDQYGSGKLVSLWLAGRLAVCLSAWIGAVAAAVIDCAFLAALVAVAAREIMAGENWRNLRVLVLVGLLLAGNVTFHAEAATAGQANVGIRLGTAVAVAFNAPRFVSWIGPLISGSLIVSLGGYGRAATMVGLFYIVGLAAAPFLPETNGEPLPETGSATLPTGQDRLAQTI